MHRFFLLVLLAGVLWGVTSPLTAHAGGGFTPKECLAEAPADRTVDCGTVSLPLHAEDPTGPQIELPIMIVRSTTSNDHRPLFLLQGGPGGDSIETFVSIMKKPDSTIPVDRDVVFFEQRGTTHAKPTLNCPELTANPAAPYAPGVTAAQRTTMYDTAWRTCADRLRAAGVDLSAYNSDANADDVAAIAAMLGHESIDLYGVSYGSLLAQHVIRRHPALVHALVLDGVVPTAVNPQTQWLQSRQTAFSNLLTDCAADTACNTAYPDLSTRLPALISRINTTPLTLTVRDLASGSDHTVVQDGDDVAGVFFQMLYDSEMATYVPMLIDQLEHNNTQAFRSIAGLFLFYDGMSEGMQATTTCAEEVPATPADYALPDPSLFPLKTTVVADDITDTQHWCAIAAVPQRDAAMNQPVVSSVPTLISSGRYDPITPAALAARVVPGFAHATVIVTPNAAHGAILDNACAGQIFVAFLDNPEVEPDTTCLAAERTVFATPATVSVTPAAALALQGTNPVGVYAWLGLAGFLWLVLILAVRPLAFFVRVAQQKAAPAANIRLFHTMQLLTGGAALWYVCVLLYVLYDSALVQNSAAFLFGIPKTPLYSVSLWAFPLLSLGYLGTWVQLVRSRTQRWYGGLYALSTVLALGAMYAALIELGVYPG